MLFGPALPLSLMVIDSPGEVRVVGAKTSKLLPLTTKLTAGVRRSSRVSSRGTKRPFGPLARLEWCFLMGLLSTSAHHAARGYGVLICSTRQAGKEAAHQVRARGRWQWPSSQFRVVRSEV